MKIRKLCTYENIQLEGKDGKRPTGTYARLSKTFLCDHFDMTLLPGIGVTLSPKDDHEVSFVIPFANIPYIVTEPDSDKDANANNNYTVRRRRRRRTTDESAPQAESAWLSEGSHGAD